MKKKIAALILVLIMTLSFAACGNKQTPNTPSQDNRQAYENVELSLGDTLPNITLWGTYYAADITEEESASGLAAGFYTENSNEPHVYIWQWDMQGKSLEEFAAEKFNADDSKTPSAKCIKCNNWKAEDDYEYYYYVTYSEFNTNYYIVRNYFFAEEDQCVALRYYNKLQTVETGCGDTVVQLPVEMTEATYEVKPEDLIAVYYDADNKYPMVYLSAWNDSEINRQDVLNQFDERYGLEYQELFNLNESNGKSIPMGLMQFREESGSMTLQETEYFAMLDGGNILFINFVTDAETGDMQRASIPALLDAVNF